MDAFQTWTQNLIDKSDVSDPSRNVYKLPESYEKALSEWKETVEFNRILDTIKDSYIRFQSDRKAHPDIDFMKKDASNGFILDVYNLNLPLQNCMLLLAYWRGVILEESYFDSMSDLTVTPTNKINKVFIRHYLKPRRRKLGMSDQKYGNIEMVLNIRGKTPQHIKFLANTYRDANYDEPEDFGHLIFKITQS